MMSRFYNFASISNSRLFSVLLWMCYLFGRTVMCCTLTCTSPLNFPLLSLKRCPLVFDISTLKKNIWLYTLCLSYIYILLTYFLSASDMVKKSIHGFPDLKNRKLLSHSFTCEAQSCLTTRNSPAEYCFTTSGNIRDPVYMFGHRKHVLHASGPWGLSLAELTAPRSKLPWIKDYECNLSMSTFWMHVFRGILRCGKMLCLLLRAGGKVKEIFSLLSMDCRWPPFRSLEWS